MAKFKINDERESGVVVAPGSLANTNNDLLTVDFSYFAEGYGISTSFSNDSNGGWRGYYYIDANNRADFVSIERFNITGTDYADTIQVGNNDDVVRAGGGNDLVIAGAGRDTLDGGAGIDGLNKNFSTMTTGVTVNLATNSITNSQGSIRNFEYFSDVIGSTRADVFISSTLRGNDTVNAGDGNDRGEFMRGYDRFTGGAGNDSVKIDFSYYTGPDRITTSLTAESSETGYRGYYYVNGGTRLDFATTENFEVVGTLNNDIVYSGNGNDILSGGAGDDDLRSGSGIDQLDGGTGIDGLGRDFSTLTADVSVNLITSTITGIDGSIANFEFFSDIFGGFGNDTFVTTAFLANDFVTGGGGNDTATFYAGYDRFTAGLGTDRLIADYSQAYYNTGITTYFELDASGGYRGYYIATNNARVDFSGVEAVTVTGTVFDDSITAGDGDDVISSGDGWDIVRSGGGSDVLDGGAGIDGLGRNFLNSTANITINLDTDFVRNIGGSIANFEYFSNMVTGAGNDTLQSIVGLWNDNVSTGGGNDTFLSFGGDDDFTAGLGTDRLVMDYSTIMQGTGVYSVSLTADTDGGYRGYFYISGSARVDFTSVEAFTLTGTIYNDNLQGREGDDILSGGDGNDVLTAGSGNDTIDGGAGIDGFAKDMSAQTRAITVDLTTSTLSLAGSSIANVEYMLDVRGGTGNDTFRTLTESYDDTMFGNGGNDTAFVFGGYDRFTAGSGNGDQLVVDYSALDLENGISTSMQVDDDNGGFRGYYYVDGGNRIDFSGLESARVTGTKNNDSIYGTGGNDVLNGGDGRDTLDGGAGNDKLNGGDAADTIVGGAGRDTITGGAGGDVMTGGDQADIFIFAQGDTNRLTPYADRITDFTTGSDKIDLSRIDANAGAAGNQAFTFIGEGAFTGAGQLRVASIGGVMYVQGNTDADLGVDFLIRVDSTVPVEGDFRL